MLQHVGSLNATMLQSIVWVGITHDRRPRYSADQVQRRPGSAIKRIWASVTDQLGSLDKRCMLRAMHASRQWCRERSCSRMGSSLRKGTVEAAGAGRRGGCDASRSISCAHCLWWCGGVDMSDRTDLSILSRLALIMLRSLHSTRNPRSETCSFQAYI